MQVDVPFSVEYQTTELVPIGQVIDSLVALRELIEEGSNNLVLFDSSLSVTSISINIREVSQQSPLREILLVSLFLGFQEELEAEIPAMVKTLTGSSIPESMDTLVTVSVLIVLFYGAGYIKDVILGSTVNTPIKRKLKALVDELSARTGMPADEIQKVLDKRYSKPSRISNLAASAFKFFRPSKSQNNVPINIDGRQIETEIISDVPQEYAYEEEAKVMKSEPFSGIVLDIHAQDRDREATGWAAVPKGITDKRLKMRLTDGVKPEQLWNKNQVVGDGVVLYKRVGMDFVPTEIHLGRIAS